MNKCIVLASGSPRRKELLSRFVKDFKIVVSNIDELYNKDLSPCQIPLFIAHKKCIDVKNRIKENAIIIAADTIVVCNNKVYGKPISRDDAFNTLNNLKGKTHSVITGFYCIDTYSDKHISFIDETFVTFYNYDNNDIEKYLSTNEYIDKAGSYAIQGYGSFLIEKIDGNYDNVVGLPIAKLLRNLKNINIELF